MSTYAVADLHGRLDLYQQIKNFLKPEDKVYFLGDAGDRGPEPWKTIEAIYNDPQFIYMKGNHEDMLVDAFYGEYEEIALCDMNGGRGTRIQMAESEEGWRTWAERLNKLPLVEIYHNAQGQTVILSHAGYTPEQNIDFRPYWYDILWNRRHFWHNWPEDEQFADTIVVHGHTPIPFVMKELKEFFDFYNEKKYEAEPWDGGALWYCHDHKVCIDCGSAWYDCCVLLDLDTWDEHIFQGEAFKDEFLTEEV